MENFEKFPSSPGELPSWEREFKYKSGEMPLEYSHIFRSGENLKAFQDERGIAHFVIEENGKIIFNADDLVPEEYVLAAPLYVEQELEKQGKEVPLFGTGEWTIDHTHKLINIGEFSRPEDLLSLLHEIGHARLDKPEEIQRIEEMQKELEEANRNKDKTYAVLLAEDAAPLISERERSAWAYAIKILRGLSSQGFDFHNIFPGFDLIKLEIDQNLLSYRKAYERQILKNDPSFYKDLQKLFDK